MAAKQHAIEGGGHGGFSVAESLAAYRVIREFLVEHGVIERGEGVTPSAA